VGEFISGNQKKKRSGDRPLLYPDSLQVLVRDAESLLSDQRRAEVSIPYDYRMMVFPRNAI